MRNASSGFRVSGEEEEGRQAPRPVSYTHLDVYKRQVYDYTKFEGSHGARRTSAEQVLYLEELISKYPIDT